MKRNQMIKTLALVSFLSVALLLTTSVMAGDYGAKTTAAKDSGKSMYFIEVTHTPEQCLKTLDEVKDMGKDKLMKWEWGCMSGNHTGYLMVEANNQAEALNWVPMDERSSAKVIKLNKFSMDQIAEFHKKSH
jgi:hypothetical protein